MYYYKNCAENELLKKECFRKSKIKLKEINFKRGFELNVLIDKVVALRLFQNTQIHKIKNTRINIISNSFRIHLMSRLKKKNIYFEEI